MSGIAYNIVAAGIFVFVAFNFLFPCNSLIPLDRRTTSVLGAILCYLTRRFIFPDTSMNVVHAVDFDVMILLSSIMIINHLVVHLKETKDVIEYLQVLVQSDPVRGFWVISFAAFVASPFLTNDGVCLLFVEPILAAFESAPFAVELVADAQQQEDPNKLSLRKEDALYYLLALACSANIGSALTYTGNPQNMIVASDSIGVLPSYKFLLYMLPATLLSWFITMEWIRRCWMHSRTLPPQVPRSRSGSLQLAHPKSGSHSRKSSSASHHSRSRSHSRQSSTGSQLVRSRQGSLQLDMPDDEAGPVSPVKSPVKSPVQPAKRDSFWNLSIFGGEGACKPKVSPEKAPSSPLSPRRRQALERAKMVKRVTRIVSSPFPYLVLIMLGLMIIMIFVDVMPISGLICVFAIFMVVVVVVGNHWRDKQVWIEEEEESMRADGELREVSYSTMENARHPAEDLGPLTREDKIDNLNHFFEALFNSIDYSLLIIFLGLFIVVENVASTGLPARIWASIVGKSPFGSASSIAGISLFVLLASQFLGNVAVIQLAKPNIEDLDDSTKRLAWAVISFVATVGGNLTIPGSAANIIVAEKAARLDATMSIDFFQHYNVCFWVTMLSCTIGAVLISLIALADNATGSNW